MVVELCDGQCACCDKHDLRFAHHSTCHGLSRICNTWHVGRRIFWFLLVLGCMCLLVQQLYERISIFLRFEIKTEVLVETYSSLILPTVTICNMNMFSKSLLTPMDYELLELSNETIHWITSKYDRKYINPGNTSDEFWRE